MCRNTRRRAPPPPPPRLVSVLLRKWVSLSQDTETERKHLLKLLCEVSDLILLPGLRASKAWRWDHRSPGPRKHRKSLWNVVQRENGAFLDPSNTISAAWGGGWKGDFQGKEDPSHDDLAVSCWPISAPVSSCASVSPSSAPDESRTRVIAAAHDS